MIDRARFGLLALGAMLLAAGAVLAQSEPETHCAGDGVCFCPDGSRPSFSCDGNCEDACGLSGGGGGGGNSDYDFEAERRAQEAAARLRPSTGIVITPNAGGGTASAGSSGSKAPTRSSGLPGGVAAGSQASSAATHGQVAREVSGESSQVQVSKVFDTAGQPSRTLVHPDKNAGAMPAFAATLPEPARKDPQVQAELRHYQETHALKEDAARKITAVKA